MTLHDDAAHCAIYFQTGRTAVFFSPTAALRVGLRLIAQGLWYRIAGRRKDGAGLSIQYGDTPVLDLNVVTPPQMVELTEMSSWLGRGPVLVRFANRRGGGRPSPDVH